MCVCVCKKTPNKKETQLLYSTTLLSEPVLGGKKIDLYKLYREVVAAGGFDQVFFIHFF